MSPLPAGCRGWPTAVLAALLLLLAPAAGLAAGDGDSLEEPQAAEGESPGLLLRGPSPLAPATLRGAAGEMVDHGERITDSLGRLAVREAPAEAVDVAIFWFLVLGVVAGLALGLGLRHSLRRALAAVTSSRLGPRLRAPLAGLLTALADRALSLALPATLLVALEAVHARDSLAGVLAMAGLLLFALYRLAVALFPLLGRPQDPADLARRLHRPPVDRLWRAGRGLLALTLLGGFLFHLEQELPLGAPVQALGQFLFSLAVLAVLWRLRDRPAWQAIAGGESAPAGKRALLALGRAILAAAALVPAVASGLGYHTLSTTLLMNLLATVTVGLVGGTLAAGAARALRRLEATPPPQAIAPVLTARHVSRLSRLLGLLVQATLLLGTLAIILGLWGAPLGSLWAGIAPILFGFEVGGHEISLIALIAAVVVLVLAFQVGRWSRQKLRDGLLPGFTEDAGLRNSIASLGYYAVLVLGVLLAIGVAGFDLTNLAIVAGALSVGIGFGLQNVVNNFVSGLILLFERPVRVGDVIDYQGTWATVEEIKVRSTHIRTFDQADLIVPNSELVSSTVTNWSHSGEQARVIVDVQVAYGSDTHHVRELLHQVATEHPQVDAEPAPTVLFRDFGDSALIFQLRCFTHLDNYLGVPSDLRFRIDELFRENGITIPFPQRDVHLHSADPAPAPASS
ncbi:MAG: mechanosensitive ion channel family protein [Thiohalospira sp.]